MRCTTFILVLFLLPALANAKLNRRNLLTSLSLSPVTFFHETTMHEATHLAAGQLAIADIRVTGFTPYPRKTSSGFRYGGYSTEWPHPASDNALNAVDIAPYTTAALAFTISDILLSTKVKPNSAAGTILWTFGMLAPFLDFGNGYFFGSDWKKIRSRSNSWAFDIVGGVLLVAGVCRLIRQGYIVFGR